MKRAPDQKMIVLIDVYCRHRDKEFLDLVKQRYPNILLLFVPANITEIGQPLDIYYNASFKMILARLVSYWLTAKLRVAQQTHIQQEAMKPVADRQLYNPASFVVPKKMTDLRDPMFMFLKEAIDEMKTPEKVGKIRDVAWAPYHDCFDREFQREACHKVTQARGAKSNKYFYVRSEQQVDPVEVERAKGFNVLACLDAHAPSTSADDKTRTEPRQYIGRRCKGISVSADVGVKAAYGKVRKYNKKDGIFDIAYYKSENDTRAQKILHLKISVDELKTSYLDYDWTPAKETPTAAHVAVATPAAVLPTFKFHWKYQPKNGSITIDQCANVGDIVEDNSVDLPDNQFSLQKDMKSGKNTGLFKVHYESGARKGVRFAKPGNLFVAALPPVTVTVAEERTLLSCWRSAVQIIGSKRTAAEARNDDSAIDGTTVGTGDIHVEGDGSVYVNTSLFVA